MELPLNPRLELPDGYCARVPGAADVGAIGDLVTEHRRRVRGQGSVDLEALTQEVVGTGSWTRIQAIVETEGGTPNLVAWAAVHDRAAGRTMVELFVALPHRVLAPTLLDWIAASARQIGTARGLDVTQLDGLLDEGDTELCSWFESAGYRHTRTWLNMKRPVEPGEVFPGPRQGVEIRRVRVHDLEDDRVFPVAEDLHAVHRVLEQSFEDHFNSYRESFAEFAQRLREDPGHRWDHWWLALIRPLEDPEANPVVGGALVSSVSPADADGMFGSYVDYIGVHRDARGRGVAKALLHTVLADAAERGRNRVGLEVDEDSPTGADGLYRSLGWETSYITESWQRDLAIG